MTQGKELRAKQSGAWVFALPVIASATKWSVGIRPHCHCERNEVERGNLRKEIATVVSLLRNDERKKVLLKRVE